MAHNETTTDYGIGASSDDLLYGASVYSAVELELREGRTGLLASRLKNGKCLEGAGDEGLPSGSWVDSHHDDEVG